MNWLFARLLVWWIRRYPARSVERGFWVVVGLFAGAMVLGRLLDWLLPPVPH